MIAPETVMQAKAAISRQALIGASVDLRRAGRNWVGLCPFHGEKTPSFQVYDDHYFCFGCGAHGDAIDWLTRIEGLSFHAAVNALSADVVPRKPQALPSPVPYKLERSTNAAARIWREAVPAAGSPAEAYLTFRGLQLPDAPVLRYHPACPRERDRLPAMVALMTDPIGGHPTGIHRTFIQPDGRGKAEVEKPKMMLGRAGVVRLSENVGEGLGVAEGIETALAVIQLISWGPVWATCGRAGLSKFPILPRTTLTIFADSGDPGIAAAEVCAGRWDNAGEEVWTHIPPSGVSDWLDAALKAEER